jgi:phosphate transporter
LVLQVKWLFAALPMDQFALLLAELLLTTLIISTFVSHTVAALILMPLLVELGAQVGDAAGVGVTAAFAISAAMALPFSSFPNVLILTATDDLDNQYLQVNDFLISGLPMSLIATVTIGTFGYGLVELFM